MIPVQSRTYSLRYKHSGNSGISGKQCVGTIKASGNLDFASQLSPRICADVQGDIHLKLLQDIATLLH